MIELYFIFWRIPKMMSRLARERKRSALWWSLAGIGAWLGAEFAVMFVYLFVYQLGVMFRDWPEQESGGMQLFSYALALAAAIGGLALVRRILSAMPPHGAPSYSPPPPPPQF